MTKLEAAKLPWEYTLGKKSHINLLGKIVFFPLIVILCVMISLCELLFTKNEE